MDRTYVIIRRSGHIGDEVWKNPNSPYSIGSVLERHTNYIIAKIKGEKVRFDLTENEFRDDDKDHCVEVKLYDESVKLPKDCVIGSALYDLRKDSKYDEGLVSSFEDDGIKIGFWTVGKTISSVNHIKFEDLKKYKFRRAEKCPMCNTKTYWDPSRVFHNGSEYCQKCCKWFGEVRPVIGTRFYDSSGLRCWVVTHIGHDSIGLFYPGDEHSATPLTADYKFMMKEYYTREPKDCVAQGVEIGQQVIISKSNGVVLGTVESLEFDTKVCDQLRDWAKVNTGDSHSQVIYLDLNGFHDNYSLRWIVDDEFERSINVDDIVFMKETGEKVGRVVELNDNNTLDFVFNTPKNHAQSMSAYNPRVENSELGFHRPDECETDIHRMQFVTAREDERDRKTAPQPVDANKIKSDPHMLSADKWNEILKPCETKYHVSIDPAQPRSVFDEYGLPIRVGYIVFHKKTGVACGEVTTLHEGNRVTVQFLDGVLDKSFIDYKDNTIVFDPRLELDLMWGFCDVHYLRNAEERQVHIGHMEKAELGKPSSCGRTGATIPRWVTQAETWNKQTPAQPDVSVGKLLDGGMSANEAEVYLKRMRLPEVGIGDTLTTKAGVFRFMTNGWGRVSGPLKKRKTANLLSGDTQYINITEPLEQGDLT